MSILQSTGRDKVINYTMLSNIISKALAMVAMILNVRLTLPYLGDERFGIWMTLIGLIGVLSFLDLGIGNTLTNIGAKAKYLSPKERTLSILSGLSILFITSIMVTFLLIVSLKFFSLSTFFNISEHFFYEFDKSIFCFVIIFGFSIITGGITRVVHGLQEGYFVYLFNSISSFLSIIGIFIAAKLQLGIPSLILVTFGISTFFNFLLIFKINFTFKFEIKELVNFVKNDFRSIYKLGSIFFYYN